MWVSRNSRRELLEAATWTASGNANVVRDARGLSIDDATTLRRFLHERIEIVKDAENKMQDADSHYDKA